jgi:hypothetical protein
MKYLHLFIPVAFLLALSCSQLDESVEHSFSDGLVISTDTLSFDTLVAGRKSLTKRVRIVNPRSSSVTITEIGLTAPDASPYQLTINGKGGKTHQNIVINSQDSILILVDVLPENEQEEWIDEVRDYIEFVDPISDATHLITLQSWAVSVSERTKSVICDERWDRNNAQLITDTLVVDSHCSLYIEEGTRVLFDPSAALFVLGSLTVSGTAEDPVLFRASRMDDAYKQAPGFWNGVYFLEGSSQNEINHLILENSQTGLRIGTPDEDDLADVVLQNVIIRHSSQFAIQAYNSDLFAENLLVYDIGVVPCFHAIGGSYHYRHVTVTNFPSQFGSSEPAMVFADHLILEEQTLSDVLSLHLKNSIFWGGIADTDVYISLIDETSNIEVSNNIIFSSEEWEGNMTSSSLDFVGFKDPFSFNYKLDSTSPAIDASIDSDLALDLEGLLRDSIPDVGAYEFLLNE